MVKVKILYIGRFQPFHNGHLKLIKDIKDRYDEIIIGIGSSQYGFDEKNPFTVKERRLMIENTLKNNKINNYIIFEISDIHNYPKWVSHVESIIPKFDVVIANNPLTIELFKKKGYKVIKTKLYNRNVFSGEEIRKKMVNNQNWEKTVPKEVHKIILDIDGVDRLKNLAK
jgi:nicotinamide-nucleotide adenylyltransferase